MKIEYTLPIRRSLPARAFLAEPTGEPQARPHRLARVLALAHRLDEMVRSGAVSDYGALARLGQPGSDSLDGASLKWYRL